VPKEKAPPRYVNVAVRRAADLSRQPAWLALVRATEYLLLIDIGALSEDSIVANAAANPVPTELLPGEEGHWLQLAFASAMFEVPDETCSLFLPRSGRSFVCGCKPGGAHRCREADRAEFIEVPIRTPADIGKAWLRIGLYFQNNTVQSQLLTADIASDAESPGTVVSVIDYTLTSVLQDLPALEPRTLSALTNQAGETHSIVINDGSEKVIAIHLTEGQLRDAMEGFRQALLDIHLIEGPGGRVNRLNDDNGKSVDDLRSDLGDLAVLGWTAWQQLYTKADEGERLAETMRGGGGTVQVARVQDSLYVFPWAAVYDMPLDDDRSRHEPCPLVAELDGRGTLGNEPLTRCPHEADHGPKNTLCPFGFWGFRHIIEHPPSTGDRSLPKEVVVSATPSVVTVRSLDLDDQKTSEHLGRLAGSFAGFAPVPCISLAELERALSDPELEVVYFMCHGRREDGDPAAAMPYLQFGQDDKITPKQIITWHVSDWSAPPGHWEKTSPLVVINGCHTAELTVQSPVNFVDNFARARAAGVVGTEVTLSQGLASEAAEVLFSGFGQERLSIGDALRRMRLHFLDKGNLLGLAYTAYCSLDLRLANPSSVHRPD
jgi:hypothetical protein